MTHHTGSATVQFLGAAGTVTGSRHLLTVGRGRILLDCGLFQGPKELRLRNWSPSPVPAASINAVVLSHAHIDHSGYLPLLVKQGFRGPVYCTPATADLLSLLLPDSGYLQEEDAARANRRHYTRHHPALPLYTREDALRSLEYLERRPCDRSFEVVHGAAATFRPAGHILGSATVSLRLPEEKDLVYSGDLGRARPTILRPAVPIPEADWLILESTYGDRRHPEAPEERLAAVVREAAARGGAVVIPAFAVGRAQELLFLLGLLERDGRVPVLPIYLDSPMAAGAGEITELHRRELGAEIARLGDTLGRPLSRSNVVVTRTPSESKAINGVTGPVIIISASGMATGGRVLHHLRLRLPDARTTVLLPGFQAAGTRGAALQAGATELKIHGQLVPVRARVVTIDGLSAHADQAEILEWLEGFDRAPRCTWLVHGEPMQSAALARAIVERFAWQVRVAKDQDTVELT